MAKQQIKQDLNRSGWETTDMPSVCERCLPDNPYVQMTKEEYGQECKVCTRPFTVFRWKADRTSRQKRTIICLTCARLKNCCQSCMLDLNFGLPTHIRDTALKMIAPGPRSDINREYFAQENQREIEEGRGGLEVYDKTDEKATDLLRRLARNDPYARRQRVQEADDGAGMKALPAPDSLSQGSTKVSTGPGPVRTRDSRPSANVRVAATRGGRGGARGGRAFPSTAQLPPSEDDWLPPRDTSIRSLFVVGVEEDLPEYKIRETFAKYGALQSVVCSHRAHCAFINYTKREDAEVAAQACQGRAVIAGCPLRVSWGKPRQLDTMDPQQRMQNAHAARDVMPAQARGLPSSSKAANEADAGDDADGLDAQAPPGENEVNYASLAGE